MYKRQGYTNTRTFDLKDIYQNNPSDKAINQKDPLILGMTCALWTDDGVTERMIDRRLFPRILALAEQMWYQGERLDFTRFHQNILQRKEWFEQIDVYKRQGLFFTICRITFTLPSNFRR